MSTTSVSVSSVHRRPPAKRLFSGLVGLPPESETISLPAPKLVRVLAGSSLSGPTAPVKQRMILLHFCFDQLRGGTKQTTCTCEQRVPLKQAMEFIDQGHADWLVSKNPRSDKLVKSGRAVVIRRVVIDHETLFAVHNTKMPARDRKHDYIKQQARDKARNLLRKFFSAGAIPQSFVAMTDTELDRLLTDDRESHNFLMTLSPGRQKQWTDVMVYWWNNILGYNKLSVSAGEFLKDADRGTGKIVLLGSSQHTELVEAKHITDQGRVTGANFRPQFWNGGWLCNPGAGPDQFETDQVTDDAVFPDEPELPGDLKIDDHRKEEMETELNEEPERRD